MLSEVRVSNFRSFKGTHDIPLAPLTILVGENSSGKSTRLALTRLAWDLGAVWSAPGTIDFNEPPFGMGSYDDMAHYHGGQGQRASSFEIGGTIFVPPHLFRKAKKKQPSVVRYAGTFSRQAGQPCQTRLCLSNEKFNLTFDAAPDADGQAPDAGTLRLNIGSREMTVSVDGALADPNMISLRFLLQELSFRNADKAESALASECLPVVEALGRTLRHRPYAMSPIRTKPQRVRHALLCRQSLHAPQRSVLAVRAPGSAATLAILSVDLCCAGWRFQEELQSKHPVPGIWQSLNAADTFGGCPSRAVN